MLDFLTKLVPGLLDYLKSSRQNKEEIRKVSERLDNLTDFVIELATRQEKAEKRQDKADERHDLEQQNLLLRLENILLRHGVTPPPLSPPESQSDAGQN